VSALVTRREGVREVGRSTGSHKEKVAKPCHRQAHNALAVLEDEPELSAPVQPANFPRESFNLSDGLNVEGVRHFGILHGGFSLSSGARKQSPLTSMVKVIIGITEIDAVFST